MNTISLLALSRRALSVLTVVSLAGGAAAQFPQSESAVQCGPGPGAQTINYGDHVLGCSISPATDVDSFTFLGALDDSIRLRMLTTSVDLDLRVRVLDPVGGVVVDQSCSVNQFATCAYTVPFTLSTTGLFTILFSDSGTNNAGDYRFQLERLPPTYSPPTQPLGTAIQDSIGQAMDLDFIDLELTAGCIYDLNVLTLDVDLDFRVEIFDPAGGSLVDTFCSVNQFATCSYTVNLTPTVTGTYSMIVSDQQGDNTGSYHLNLQCLFCPGGCPGPHTLTLQVDQPAGPGSLEIRNSLGRPDAFYFMALSLDPLNASNPGGGWWGGLHISWPALLGQAQFGVPFTGILDANGSSLFALPAGVVPTGLPQFHAVTRTFDASLQGIDETSNRVSFLLQ